MGHAVLGWCVLAISLYVTSAMPGSLLQGAAEVDLTTDKAPVAQHSGHSSHINEQQHSSVSNLPATPGTSTAAPQKSVAPTAAPRNPLDVSDHAAQLHKGYKHGHAGISKRNENAVLKSQMLYSEPPGGEFRFFRDDDRRRRSTSMIRSPVKRSSALRPLTARNKRDLQLDADDALALLALWASAASVPRHYPEYNRDTFVPRYMPSDTNDEMTGPEYETAEDNEIDGSDIVVPAGDDDGYPGYGGAWGAESDYAVPDRFNVMRRSPALYPLLGSYKREPSYADMSSNGHWGGFAPSPQKRFMVSKRRSGGDVYSLAQLLSEQRPEPSVPLYRRLML